MLSIVIINVEGEIKEHCRFTSSLNPVPEGRWHRMKRKLKEIKARLPNRTEKKKLFVCIRKKTAAVAAPLLRLDDLSTLQEISFYKLVWRRELGGIEVFGVGRARKEKNWGLHKIAILWRTKNLFAVKLHLLFFISFYYTSNFLTFNQNNLNKRKLLRFALSHFFNSVFFLFLLLYITHACGWCDYDYLIIN